jgi:hypothetical protein
MLSPAESGENEMFLKERNNKLDKEWTKFGGVQPKESCLGFSAPGCPKCDILGAD